MLFNKKLGMGGGVGKLFKVIPTLKITPLMTSTRSDNVLPGTRCNAGNWFTSQPMMIPITASIAFKLPYSEVLNKTYSIIKFKVSSISFLIYKLWKLVLSKACTLLSEPLIQLSLYTTQATLKFSAFGS